jgi:hypothetical protein
VKHRLSHLVLVDKPDDVLQALLATNLALLATVKGKRRMGSKSLDGARWDSQVAQLRREIRRRKRESRAPLLQRLIDAQATASRSYTEDEQREAARALGREDLVE